MDPRAIHPYVSAPHIKPLSPGPRGKHFCPGDARFGTSHVVCRMVELSRHTMTPTRACVCNGGGGGGTPTRCALSRSRSRRPLQPPSTRTPNRAWPRRSPLHNGSIFSVRSGLCWAIPAPTTQRKPSLSRICSAWQAEIRKRRERGRRGGGEGSRSRHLRVKLLLAFGLALGRRAGTRQRVCASFLQDPCPRVGVMLGHTGVSSTGTAPLSRIFPVEGVGCTQEKEEDEEEGAGGGGGDGSPRFNFRSLA